MCLRSCLYQGDAGGFMVCCDECEVWYHCDSVLLSEKEARDVERYVCPHCKHDEDLIVM